MEKALIIKNICELLLNDHKNDCEDFALKNYPFAAEAANKRQYSRFLQCKIFLRDGFIDRYSGDRLIFPGLIMLLSIEFPEIFRYHRNWKMSETHMIYWELFPTIDHIVPVARGGTDDEENLVTTSMIRNSAKSNWTLSKLGWQLHPKGELENWDGLSAKFLELCEKNPEYLQNKYVSEWRKALIKAKLDLK